MSELKATSSGEIRTRNALLGYWWYEKSEADKVIAELKDKLQNVSELLKETREWLIESQKLHKRCADNAIKTIRHHKYKRCLDMAKLCKLWYETEKNEWQLKDVHHWFRLSLYEKWHKRWLELAEKFKPNKSTAQ